MTALQATTPIRHPTRCDGGLTLGLTGPGLRLEKRREAAYRSVDPNKWQDYLDWLRSNDIR
jgi:hypothetical protein